MRFITIISDWHNDDFYTAALKGSLYSNCHDIQVVDINNKIDPFEYNKASFILKNTYFHFPKGTIHLIAINSSPAKNQHVLCVEYKDHYFIGTGMEIFSLLLEEKPKSIIELNNQEFTQTSFPELTIFTKVASYICNETPINQLGKEIELDRPFFASAPQILPDQITGQVVHIDSYGNLITNITEKLFNNIRKDRDFVIEVKREAYSITKISKSYHDVGLIELLALFNSIGVLEIAERNGSIAQTIGMELNSLILVKFK